MLVLSVKRGLSLHQAADKPLACLQSPAVPRFPRGFMNAAGGEGRSAWRPTDQRIRVRSRRGDQHQDHYRATELRQRLLTENSTSVPPKRPIAYMPNTRPATRATVRGGLRSERPFKLPTTSSGTFQAGSQGRPERVEISAGQHRYHQLGHRVDVNFRQLLEGLLDADLRVFHYD